MTEIERKALALVNEVLAERVDWQLTGTRADNASIEALCRAIEQHEAFRKEVSDALEYFMDGPVGLGTARERLGRFIIPKPDPLVEALNDMLRDSKPGEDRLEVFRAALAARGLKIVWGEG